jgi:hypothetical protein
MYRFPPKISLLHISADFLTFKPFVDGYKERFGEVLKKLIADSGYGSEANYDFMEAIGIESFVKFPMFHKEQKKSFKNNAFSAQNLFYNAGKDFFVCPIGQRMRKMREGTRESGSDSVSHVSYYEAKNCTNCPLQSLCHSAEGNRRNAQASHSWTAQKLPSAIINAFAATESLPALPRPGKAPWAGFTASSCIRSATTRENCSLFA